VLSSNQCISSLLAVAMPNAKRLVELVKGQLVKGQLTDDETTHVNFGLDVLMGTQLVDEHHR
jgi:hypothetical protein